MQQRIDVSTTNLGKWAEKCFETHRKRLDIQKANFDILCNNLTNQLQEKITEQQTEIASLKEIITKLQATAQQRPTPVLPDRPVLPPTPTPQPKPPATPKPQRVQAPAPVNVWTTVPTRIRNAIRAPPTDKQATELAPAKPTNLAIPTY